MSEVWVATNLTEDGKNYGALIRAGDLRRLRLTGNPRPRLMAHVPGSEGTGWVPLVDTPSAPPRFDAAFDDSTLPPALPHHFHLDLASTLDTARVRASVESQPLIVRAVLTGDGWRWVTETYGAALREARALTDIVAPSQKAISGTEALRAGQAP